MSAVFFERSQIPFISLDKWLQSGVDIAFSTRSGGVSQGRYTSLNLGLHVNDEDERVLENRKRYLALFNADLDKAVCGQQVHGNQVIKVGKTDRGRGAYRLAEAIPDCDAMITNSPEVYLLSLYADCLPVFFYDPAQRAIGTAHCGWKGTMAKIAVNTLQAMQREFASSAELVQVFIGPGIGPCCFEIKPDLVAKVHEEFADLHDIITDRGNGAFTWDLAETNTQILIKAGVNPEHIRVCRLCTACHPELFYSYRKENGQTGRMGALIGLRY